ncbi:Gp138 family membrane-puncturing spike protein [Orenia marismortui]|uniref:Gp138 family membrane-puncturing spike protein n=1 Tax=Orenia marismortui TaxID=46469 RepID=UPI0003705BA6|nr:Gp138 family membrane-puncturing spike protein [Orenia marismortui]
MNLNKLIKGMLDKELEDIHIALPAKIQNYDPEKMIADIVVLAKKELGEEEVEIPPVLEVPVSHFKAGPFIIRPPYNRGDVVQVLFNERAIDNLLASNRAESPEFNRKHSLDDAIVIAGLKTERESSYPSDHQEDFLIYNRDTQEKAVLKKAGGAILEVNDLVVESSDIKLGSKDASEALALLSELEDVINTFNKHTHTAPSGTTGTPLKPISELEMPSGTSKVVAE